MKFATTYAEKMGFKTTCHTNYRALFYGILHKPNEHVHKTPKERENCVQTYRPTISQYFVYTHYKLKKMESHSFDTLYEFNETNRYSLIIGKICKRIT